MQTFSAGKLPECPSGPSHTRDSPAFPELDPPGVHIWDQIDQHSGVQGNSTPDDSLAPVPLLKIKWLKYRLITTSRFHWNISLGNLVVFLLWFSNPGLWKLENSSWTIGILSQRRSCIGFACKCVRTGGTILWTFETFAPCCFGNLVCCKHPYTCTRIRAENGRFGR